jgi:hypothetical protein
MDEFFAAEEHQALAEPMVIESACSAPVAAERIVIRVRLPARRPAMRALKLEEARYTRPARTGPPAHHIPMHGAYRVIGGAVCFSGAD